MSSNTKMTSDSHEDRARIRREVLEELDQWLVNLGQEHPMFQDGLNMSRLHVQRFLADEPSRLAGD